MKKKKPKKVIKTKRASGKKTVTGKRSPKKKSAKKAAPKKRPATRVRGPRPQAEEEPAVLGQRSAQATSGAQSGDLQGLRNTEGADSESVNELVEEGNAFEADAVAGVERADDQQEREVFTQEVPEDDVPEEYLDKD